MRIFLLFVVLWAVVCNQSLKPVYTQVTYMYNIKRGDMPGQYKRSYEYYLSYFDQLLASDSNIIVFGGKDLKDFVWKRRKEHNTVFVEKQIETYKDLWYYPYTQKLRNQFMSNPSFPYKTHPQFALEYYNPIIMAKLFVMTEALKHDKWNTDILVWTDGGHMHIFPKNIASPENVIEKYYQILQPQWMFFTYTDPNMFMGYKQSEARYINRRAEVYEPVLASNMGGYIQILRDIKCAFQNLLRITLENGDMNSDESVITMMPIRFPFLIPYTTGIYLSDMATKLHMYEGVNRIPQHKRYLKGKFDKSGTLQIIENKTVTKFEMNPIKTQARLDNEERQKDKHEILKLTSKLHQQLSLSKKILQMFITKKELERKRVFQQAGFLGFLVIAYLFIFVKSRSIRKRAHIRVVNANSQQISRIVTNPS